VANGRQAVTHVSSPPSKIPYGGFSPVRLQIGLLDAIFAPAHRGGCLYATIVRVAHLRPLALPLSGGGRGCREPTDPEALGSPTGYAVPPGHRLLWPHPRLWPSPAGLCSSPSGLCLAAKGQRFPALICSSFFPCRLPCPGGSDGLRLLYFHPHWPSPNPDGLGIRLTHARVGSRVEWVTRLHSSLDAAARKVAGPAPTPDFYIRAFVP